MVSRPSQVNNIFHFGMDFGNRSKKMNFMTSVMTNVNFLSLAEDGTS